ncbi:hypothetical protein F4604DRAFT_1956250 [Suillus subluteus]|nr:hypothetical protein F4604DRAFT_1956250 [Suillus subluteus]
MAANGEIIALETLKADSTQTLLASNSSTSSEYSAVVDRAHVPTTTDIPISLSSILTIRPALDPNGTAEPTTTDASLTDNSNTQTSSDSIMSAQSYQTAQSFIQRSTTMMKGVQHQLGDSPRTISLLI